MRLSLRTSVLRSRRARHVLGALVVASLPLLATGQTATGPVCWTRTMELIDRTVNPTEGGDNSFFTKVGGAPPAGLMIFANTPSMLKLPGFNPSAATIPLAERGCAKNVFLNSRTWKAPSPLYAYDTTVPAGGRHKVTVSNMSNPIDCVTTITGPTQSGKTYDKNFIYPRIDDGCYMNRSYKTLDNIDPALFYANNQWGDDGFGVGMSIAGACDTMPSSEKSDCTKCVDNQGEGYYISVADPTRVVFDGNFLHFYGPMYFGALGAWKTSIAGNAKIRWGHGYYDSTLPGVAKGRDPNPECNKFDTDFNDSNRASYLNAFSNNPPPFGTITKFPLAQAILQMGYFLTGQSTFGTPDETQIRTRDWEPQQGRNQDTICASCQFNATIVITDGNVSDDTNLPSKITSLNVATPGDYTNKNGTCSSDTQCGDSTKCVLGFCVDRLGLTCTQPSDCGPNYQCAQSGLFKTCQNIWYADDVAAYFQNNDIRKGDCGNYSCDPNAQSMNTYVINVGTKGNPALRNVATKGNGLYIEAASVADIRDAMATVVNDIIRRSTSYSVASVTSVQTRTTTAVFVPRFKPSVQTNWEGHLYRFKLFNENAAGCTPADYSPVPPATKLSADQLSRNPNGNSSCGDVYTVDANGKFVGENSNGDYMVLDANFQPTDVAAVPIWDAADRLTVKGPSARKIMTYVDANSNGAVDTGEQIDFTAANVNSLLPALNLGGVTGTFCAALSASVGQSFSTESVCAQYLIRWIRGEDIFDENSNGLTTDPRPLMLGDIFHSSPILVVPPLNRSQTTSGFNKQQSSPSLFGTPTVTTNSSGVNQYDAYVTSNATRTRFVLVGTNGGMLHAFQAGAYHTGDDPDTAYNEPTDNVWYDQGTGDELWAFIPPELLPKLKLMLMGGAHQEYVDGSPMVRDVWTDLNKDGKKTSNEFRTVAVTGMRRGGRTFFALDVTSPSAPIYLWTAPKLGTPDYLMAGWSYGEFAPKPPPIVPMAVKNTSPYTSAFTRKSEAAREQWVIWLGGGYDPAGIRGRSINAYDMWSGSQVYRYAAWETSSGSDPRSSMGPVASAIAMVNWGDPATDGADAGSSPFFDVANVGDVFGNIWTVRMLPNAADSNNDGLYDNWYAGRAFETNKGNALAQKLPFFQMPQHVIFPTEKVLRLYMGTGDRSSIRDLQGGVCNLNNIPACLRKGCSVDVSMTKQNIGSGGTTWTSTGRLTANGTSTTLGAYSVSASGTSAPICSAPVDVSFSTRIDCSGATVSSGGTAPPAAQTFNYGLTCATGIEPCTTKVTRPNLTASAFPFDGPTLNNRFYGIPVFGAALGRSSMGSTTEATGYDAARLTETSSTMASPGSASSGGTFASLTGTYQGWYLNLGGAVTANPQDERASDIADVPDGQPYVYWQTFTPGVLTSGTDICTRQANDTGALYHADLVTGGSAADTGTNVNRAGTLVARTTTQSVITPPKTLIEQKVVTPSGQVISTLLSIEPGQTSPKSIETGRTDLYTPIQVLEIDRATHECRHGSPAKCQN